MVVTACSLSRGSNLKSPRCGKLVHWGSWVPLLVELAREAEKSGVLLTDFMIE